MKQIVSRITAPTPSFFKKLRNIGLALVAVATTIVTAPIAIPAIIVTIAGYLAVAGGVLTAVSQTAVESE
jgi:ABC-type xylose transport system permease subunit